MVTLKELEVKEKQAGLLRTLDRSGQSDQATESIRKQILSSPAIDSAAERSGFESFRPQEFHCVVFAPQTLVRAEGLSERLSDLVLSFERDPLAQPVDTPSYFDISITLTIQITNSLTVDYCTRDTLLHNPGSEDSGKSPSDLTGAVRSRDSKTIDFRGVEISPGLGDKQIIRISGLRGNATATPVDGDGSILAYISFQPSEGSSGSIAVANGGLVTVGQARQGLIVTRPDSGSYHPEEPVTLHNGVVRERLRLKFHKGFSAAFKTVDEERGAGSLRCESVTNGTRLLARFYDVPERLDILVTVSDIDPDEKDSFVCSRFLNAVLVSDCNRDGSGGHLFAQEQLPATSGDPIPLSRLESKRGSMFAVWEWTSDNPNSAITLEEIQFGLLLEFRPGTVPVGAMQTDGTLAPVSDMHGKSFPEKIDLPSPRFIDSNMDPSFVFTWCGPMTENEEN